MLVEPQSTRKDSLAEPALVRGFLLGFWVIWGETAVAPAPFTPSFSAALSVSLRTPTFVLSWAISSQQAMPAATITNEIGAPRPRAWVALWSPISTSVHALGGRISRAAAQVDPSSLRHVAPRQTCVTVGFAMWPAAAILRPRTTTSQPRSPIVGRTCGQVLRSGPRNGARSRRESWGRGCAGIWPDPGSQ